MSVNDWSKMRDLVLQRFRAKYAVMSDYLRNLPTIHFQDPDTMQSILVSPSDAIREVTNLSDLGKKIIAAEISKLQNLQP